MQVLAITIQKKIAKAFLSVYFLKYKFAFQILDGKRLRVIRRPCVTWQEPKLKNKGSSTTTMEDLENMTRDAVGIDTNHPTRLLSLEYGFSKAQDDDSNYEREASKQWR